MSTPSADGAISGEDAASDGGATSGADAASGDGGPGWIPATGVALDWCHARLRRGSAGAEDPEDRGTVQSMPIVLHVPKAERPGRTPLLEAAAGAVARFCLDARVAPEGEWHEPYAAWLDARMRKIARRARGAQWRTAGQVDGVGCEVDDCAARAFVPGPVDAVDPRLGRLQIGGTELDRDEPGPAPVDVPVVWIDAALEMTLGKAAAQVGHGVMLLAASLTRDRLEEWIAEGLPLAVREADSETWRELLVAVGAGGPGGSTGSGRGDRAGIAGVVDAGYTEVAPGSLTVIAVDPRSGHSSAPR